MSVDTLTLMNGLLKKKIINYDYSLKTCEKEVLELRDMVNEDNMIIKARNKEIVGLNKTVDRQAKFMKIFFPILGGLVLGGVTYAILK